MYSYQDVLAEVLIDEQTLDKRIKELGAQISEDYQDKDPVLICILRGGVVFLIDLMQEITVPHKIEFMAVSSYGAGKRKSEGQVHIDYDLRTDIRDKDVLIVEDIIDSGNSLNAVLPFLREKQPRSIEICTLLDKSCRRVVDIHVKYVGFEIPDKFVYGYGLDLDDYFRNLPFVAVVDTEKLAAIQKKTAKE